MHRIIMVAVLMLASCEPLGPLAGKDLAGVAIDYPDDWSPLQAEVVQLETRGPYSVNLWGVSMAQRYYIVSARGNEARWVQRIATDSNVRLRIGDTIIAARAVVVDDPSVQDEVKSIFEAKYELDSEADAGSTILFRLDPR